MASRTVVHLEDDIDGSEAQETVIFGLDGATYEIDLNEAHAEDIREILAPYMAAARRAGGPAAARTSRAGAPRPRASSEGSGPDPKAVRAWASEHGIEVSARGRISSEVMEKYKAAQV